MIFMSNLGLSALMNMQLKFNVPLRNKTSHKREVPYFLLIYWYMQDCELLECKQNEQ